MEALAHKSRMTREEAGITLPSTSQKQLDKQEADRKRWAAEDAKK